MDGKTSPGPEELSEADAVGLFAASRVAMVLTNPRLEDNPLVYVNTAFERMTGYSRSAILGRNCRFLQGAETKAEDVRTLREAIQRGEDANVTLRNYRADGSAFENSLLVAPIMDPAASEPIFFLGLQRDVTNDRHLEERDAMNMVIAELQHRVKNHLAMIVGLIRIQGRKSEKPEEYNELSRRVESLQLLYEEMTSAAAQRNDDAIALGSYLGRVAAAIAHLDGRSGVRMNIDVPTLMVQTDKAVRIGLIVSEVLTNAMKHAFIGRAEGLVELRVTRASRGDLRVVMSDDGIGLPEEVDWPNDGSLGGRIVQGLCEGLDATLELSRGAVGTSFTLEVPKALD